MYGIAFYGRDRWMSRENRASDPAALNGPRGRTVKMVRAYFSAGGTPKSLL
jgi:hypothetical protein